MSSATLNGARVLFCRVSIPAWGVWNCDVEVESATLEAGDAATLVLDDLTLVGTVLTGGAVNARPRYRIAAGAAGWGKTIAARSETNDLGVKYATIVNAAAQACGETMGTIPTGTAGPAYTRAEEPAARCLDDLFPRGWYVDEAGVTQIGTRTATTWNGKAARISDNRANGILELAPDGIATLLPGAVVDGLEAVDVEHVLDGKLRTTIYGKGIADTNRLTGALGRLVEAFTAGHRFYAPWEYRVVQRSGERYDLQVIRVSSGMPDLRLVRIRPGVSGLRARPKVGSHVLVQFVNGDPSRPYIAACDEYGGDGGDGFIPDALYVQAGTTGTEPTEHATSAQTVVAAMKTTLAAIGAALTTAGEPGGAAITTLSQDAGLAVLVATLAATTLGATTKTAITTALAAKTADTGGDTPGLGWPSVRGG